MINKNSLQARINNLSAKTGVHQNILLKSFFLDAFLKRLSISKYSDNFVFKGGFLLSTSLGIDLRSTMDIDFLLRKIDLDKEIIAKTFKEILSIEIDDNVVFEYSGIQEIRQEDEYGGYSVTILGKLENIREMINIDIATGDPVTPHAVSYDYNCLFDDETLHFKAYNYETILAEKLQTILFRGVTNSRSKDFYDVYIIYKLKWNGIDTNILKEAFINTCNYRGTKFGKEESLDILNDIVKDSRMSARWTAYSKKNKYVGNIKFEETIEATLMILKTIF